MKTQPSIEDQTGTPMICAKDAVEAYAWLSLAARTEHPTGFAPFTFLSLCGAVTGVWAVQRFAVQPGKKTDQAVVLPIACSDMAVQKPNGH